MERYACEEDGAEIRLVVYGGSARIVMHLKSR
jgi:hypothetical protein